MIINWFLIQFNNAINSLYKSSLINKILFKYIFILTFQNHVEIIKLLLKAKIDTWLWSRYDRIAMIEVIINNHKKIVELLITMRENVKIWYEYYNTLLIIAIHQNYMKIIKILLKIKRNFRS